jgi:hypothetical protein
MISLARKQKSFLWIGLATILMAATIPAAIWITHTGSAELGNSRARCDRDTHARHTVNIQNDQIIPATTVANKCDTLVITNRDSVERIIAFGPHENHISYDGVSEQLLAKDKSMTITLIKTGTYSFHDHDQETVSGTFTVN